MINIYHRKLYFYMVIIILIFNENLFYILPNNPYWRLLSILFSVILIGPKIQISAQNKSIFNFVLCFILIGFLSLVYTVLQGLQSVSQALLRYQSILMIVACLPFLKHSSRFGERMIRNAIEVVVTVVSTIYIVQSMLYPKYIFITAGLSLRNGFMRTVVGSTIFAIGLLLIIGDVISTYGRKGSLKYIVAAIITGYNILFIIQTRSLNFAIIASICFCIYRTIDTKKFRGKQKIWWRLTSGAILIVIVIWSIGYVGEIIGASLSNNESSSINRLGAYQYYLQLFSQYPLFGIGMIRNQAIDGLAQAGIAMKYYIDDIGLIGYLAQYGLVGFLCFLIWMKKVLKYLHANGDNAYWSILLFLIFLLPFNCLLNMDVGVLYIAFFFAMLVKEKKEEICENRLNEQLENEKKTII